MLSRKLFFGDLQMALVMFFGQGVKSTLVKGCLVQHTVLTCTLASTSDRKAHGQTA